MTGSWKKESWGNACTHILQDEFTPTKRMVTTWRGKDGLYKVVFEGTSMLMQKVEEGVSVLEDGDDAIIQWNADTDDMVTDVFMSMAVALSNGELDGVRNLEIGRLEGEVRAYRNMFIRLHLTATTAISNEPF